MSATQPGTPPDTDDDAESRGLGPIVKPEKEADDDGEGWFPWKPGFEMNKAGQLRTVEVPKP